MGCIIYGCQQQAIRFCPDHWYALPLKLRQRWWRETDYSNNAPSAELIIAVNRAIDVHCKPLQTLQWSTAAWRKRMGWDAPVPPLKDRGGGR